LTKRYAIVYKVDNFDKVILAIFQFLTLCHLTKRDPLSTSISNLNNSVCIAYCSSSQPGVREKLTGGAQNVETHSKEAHLGRIFDLRVRKKDTTLIWGMQRKYF
jgi:hypothetical protein